MKIKAEHFETLRAAVSAQHSSELETRYQKAGLSAKRYRWDLLWFATINGERSCKWVSDNLYLYCDDSHIDTALRRIIGA